MQLEIRLIRIDGDTQSRVNVNEGAIQEYAEALEANAEFPDVVVYHDGEAYWLSEGFHRLAAHQLLRRKKINAEVRQGGRRDALLNSLGSNARHGLQRTNKDKRHAVEACLKDEEWSKWSNRQIAKACAVSESLVRTIRDDLSAFKTQMRSERMVERHGQAYAMKLGKLVEKASEEDSTTPTQKSLLANGNGQHLADNGKPDAGDSEQNASDPHASAPAADTSPDASPDASDDKDEDETFSPTVDAVGIPVPPRALTAFGQVPAIKELCKRIDQLSRDVASLGGSPAGLYLHPHSVQTHLANAKNGIWQARPSHVCPYCKGQEADCKACKGCGWVTASTFDSSPGSYEAKEATKEAKKASREAKKEAREARKGA